ncbi:MAG TPA: DUF72 domain-containing protein, partial [Chitinophagaceae bacterium]|nr:DUF72 domain-containing protein [Chitinophagaceae bacterium]
YRFPQEANLKAWHDKAPEHFLFSVKVPQTITHQQQFKDTATVMQEFYDVVTSGLGAKLGPILFQLPPQFAYSPERLQAILAQLNWSYTNVIEFRHISWWRPEVMQELGEQNICFCGVSYPGLIDNVVINTPQVYYRFHGVPKLYHSLYPTEFLRSVTDSIRSAGKVQRAFLYFNNTASGAALENARVVQELVGAGVSRPEENGRMELGFGD